MGVAIVLLYVFLRENTYRIIHLIKRKIDIHIRNFIF